MAILTTFIHVSYLVHPYAESLIAAYALYYEKTTNKCSMQTAVPYSFAHKWTCLGEVTVAC